MLEVLKIAGADLGNEPRLVKSSLNKIFVGVADIDLATDIQLKEATEDAMSEYTAITYLQSADKSRYGKLQEDLANQNAQGFEDVYPSNLVEAYRLLTHYNIDPKNLARLLDGAHFDGLSFFQDDNDFFSSPFGSHGM